MVQPNEQPPERERQASDDPRTGKRTPLPAAPGTRQAKLERFAEQRPALYAARHVVAATGQVVLTVLGLGILFRALLPRIDWSWLPHVSFGWLPDIDLSWIPDPLAWLVGLLPGLPELAMPGWVMLVLASWKLWGPILIAVFVAVGEVRRRKARKPTSRTAASVRPTGPVTSRAPDSSGAPQDRPAVRAGP